MKKLLCAVAAMVFALSPAAAACAEAGLPTINQALQQGAEGRRIEVSDRLDGYSVLNEMFEDFNGTFRVLILERKAPAKEFTAKKAFPPFSSDDGFPDDYTGVDIGEGRVWLRGDLMQQLPADYRAGSLEEATYLIMAEDLYELGGTVSVSDFKDNGVEELPEFESSEEMAQYLLDHPKVVESITYYPKFGVYTCVSFYDTATKKNLLYNYQYTEPMWFARNPEAALYWDDMDLVSDLLDSLDESEGVDTDRAESLIDLTEYVPQEQKDRWLASIGEGDYAAAYASVAETFWTMAEELKGLDPSEKNRKQYDQIIAERNMEALALFVNFCDYSGFERSIESIEASGDYMASPETEWMEATLQEVVGLFN